MTLCSLTTGVSYELPGVSCGPRHERVRPLDLDRAMMLGEAILLWLLGLLSAALGH